MSWDGAGDYNAGVPQLVLTDLRGVKFAQECVDGERVADKVTKRQSTATDQVGFARAVSQPTLTSQLTSQYEVTYFSTPTSSFGAKALCYFKYGAGMADTASLQTVLGDASNSAAAGITSQTTIFQSPAETVGCSASERRGSPSLISGESNHLSLIRRSWGICWISTACLIGEAWLRVAAATATGPCHAPPAQ